MRKEIAILTKNKQYASISLYCNRTTSTIGSYDPRLRAPLRQNIVSPEMARILFEASILTSVENGWTVIYQGQPLVG